MRVFLPKGTAYQTDSGMCGDYNSVIGFDQQAPLARFTTKISKNRLAPANAEGSLCGLFVEIDEKSGLAHICRPVSLGGALPEQVPVITEE